MTLRVALPLLLLTLLYGCATPGGKARDESRRAYVQLGLGYLQQGQSERAKIPLKKALALGADDAEVNAALALVFQREDEPALARMHFQKALSAQPHDPRIRNNYGGFLYSQGQYAEAQQMFRQASADTLYPERSRVFENLGLTAIRLGQRDQAREYLEKALRLNQQQPRALLEMAEMSYEDRHYVPARAFYDRHSRLSEPSARSLLLGNRLATVFEERTAAAELGLQLQRLYPGTPEYQQYLSEQ
ncbi:MULTISPECIES: type IV pilus biogenesis/stability protein PilW [unclassified Pseudomonas]|uniref:type IV pilus biogenesis/stability protein PilW n=1 Tax=unclassified Pseudomonas TaxID=196821 RepID=UPI0021C93FBE|nr:MULTISPECIES: type IV pilus biogenesis/stability protein PilW [unclassified Pseudomonas]MCU1730810.1 type IV pilus biogenesis/stability protein PilW [Pseudomonas sp. 20P_3.2_Bac4]MCU1747595.1 type IV pilus biogenesis/stability protein PilW [Pseudomonas sp. 20P_3.2_Bac5]